MERPAWRASREERRSPTSHKRITARKWQAPSVEGVVFWAVVSDEINRLIEFFPTRWQAEKMLTEPLRDEPGWCGVLRVEKIEFRTGTAN
jgi:hypothetical protein